ncbi:hypothetical protein HY640_05180 [Candidatus Woesearchaeota archaeon]|nr:hypothetical protein [Candidatus Woesearchaeota archaeon]
MKIKDLVTKQKGVDIELEVIELGIIREFSKFGQQGKVLTAIAQDKTGKINLTLWNEQTELVGIGDTVKVKDGFVSEWQGEKQITTRRTGSMEIIKPKEKTI